MNRHEVEWLSTVPVAHRGLHDAGKPENSMPAFQAAVDSGYGIELDVHSTADGKLVVFHDDTLDRMTERHGPVADLTSDELSKLRLGGTDHTIPMLDDVLRVVAGSAPVLIEVKTGSPMAVVGPSLLAALDGYSGPAAVQSFDPRVLAWVRKNAPGLVRGQIASSFRDEKMPAPQKLLLRSMVLNAVTRPQFVAFDVNSMPSVFVSAWRKLLRIPLLLWTVRTADQLAKASGYGANVIFEDVRPPRSV